MTVADAESPSAVNTLIVVSPTPGDGDQAIRVDLGNASVGRLPINGIGRQRMTIGVPCRRGE